MNRLQKMITLILMVAVIIGLIVYSEATTAHSDLTAQDVAELEAEDFPTAQDALHAFMGKSENSIGSIGYLSSLSKSEELLMLEPTDDSDKRNHDGPSSLAIAEKDNGRYHLHIIERNFKLEKNMSPLRHQYTAHDVKYDIYIGELSGSPFKEEPVIHNPETKTGVVVHAQKL